MKLRYRILLFVLVIVIVGIPTYANPQALPDDAD